MHRKTTTGSPNVELACSCAGVLLRSSACSCSQVRNVDVSCVGNVNYVSFPTFEPRPGPLNHEQKTSEHDCAATSLPQLPLLNTANEPHRCKKTTKHFKHLFETSRCDDQIGQPAPAGILRLTSAPVYAKTTYVAST